MQRRNAVLSAALVTLVMTAGATAVAVNGDLLASHASPSGPGTLSPVTTADRKVIVETVPGATVTVPGAVATTAPSVPTAPTTPTTMRTVYVADLPPVPTAPTAPSGSSGSSGSNDEGHERDHEGSEQGGEEDD